MKQLKQRSLLVMLLLPVIAGLGLTSCSGDDLESNPSDNNSRFYVSVTDGGYFSTQDGIYTKSSEQGYTTEFTAGDHIGVFAVKNNQIIAEVNNLCLTATDNNGALVWKDTGGNAPLKFDGAVYYAYYPYQSSLTGTLVLTAMDADGFFANVVSNWTPSTDQGVYTKYTAQDLMTAQGVISNSELSFAMQHEMALAVIELPGTKYKFSNANPSVPDYITAPLDTKFDGYRPYRMNDGMYRYLVKPGSTNKLTGSYTIPSGTAKGWSIAPTISGGNYKTYTIDGGQVVVSGYTLQAGDYMLKDGTLVSKDIALTDAQKANCIGIVFWVGDPTEPIHNNGTDFTDFGDPTLKSEKPGCTHGLVIALLDASIGTVWQSTPADVGSWTDINTSYGSIATNTGTDDALNKLRGYNNTQAIRAYNADGSNTNKVLPVQAIDTWAVSTPAPTTSSGWYLPSTKDLTLLCGQDVNNIGSNDSGTGMRDIVNGAINQIGSPATTIQSSIYWSGSEYASNTAHAFGVSFGLGDVNGIHKDFSDPWVRSVLAF